MIVDAKKPLFFGEGSMLREVDEVCTEHSVLSCMSDVLIVYICKRYLVTLISSLCINVHVPSLCRRVHLSSLVCLPEL